MKKILATVVTSVVLLGMMTLPPFPGSHHFMMPMGSHHSMMMDMHHSMPMG